MGREKERLPEWEDVSGAAVGGLIGGEDPPNEMRPSPKTQGTLDIIHSSRSPHKEKKKQSHEKT